MESAMLDIVDNYIEGEILFIKEELGRTSDTEYIKDMVEDLDKLENMTSEDRGEIVDNLLADGELEDKINELIHYYLYH